MSNSQDGSTKEDPEEAAAYDPFEAVESVAESERKAAQEKQEREQQENEKKEEILRLQTKYHLRDLDFLLKDEPKSNEPVVLHPNPKRAKRIARALALKKYESQWGDHKDEKDAPGSSSSSESDDDNRRSHSSRTKSSLPPATIAKNTKDKLSFNPPSSSSSSSSPILAPAAPLTMQQKLMMQIRLQLEQKSLPPPSFSLQFYFCSSDADRQIKREKMREHRS